MSVTNSVQFVLETGGIGVISDYHPGTSAATTAIKVTVGQDTVYIIKPAQDPTASRLELLHSGRDLIDSLIQSVNAVPNVVHLVTPSAGSEVNGL